MKTINTLSRFTGLCYHSCVSACCCHLSLSAAFICLAFAMHVVRLLFAHACHSLQCFCFLIASCLGLPTVWTLYRAAVGFLLLCWIGSMPRSLRASETCSSAWYHLTTHLAFFTVILNKLQFTCNWIPSSHSLTHMTVAIHSLCMFFKSSPGVMCMNNVYMNNCVLIDIPFITVGL